MRSVREIDFFKNIREIREYEFGVFYFFDGLVISEIKEDVVFNWNMAQKTIDAAYEIIGREKPIAYISNRINNYSVVPTDWLKFFTNRHQLELYSVVAYSKSGLASLILERMFFKNNIRQFSDLESAIKWSLTKLESKENLLQSQ
ncbi:hypothetical protein M3P19_10090 [Muricauda sp. 2012CJ35-5]|uniref:STAS/SEC14 domain-containing protein n=1 Tax=Flagellimonas spongiicola TaxID=2942208 RepID=A0ABT0PTQ4_9FLAO|nr:hypothetical protein [Allomuricauda spongiicola]MCL6274361.1 hypothetical protein [Allomuricauda spongiicola]